MRRAFILFLMLLLPIQTWAAAQPAYSPNFGNAMAGVIQQKAIQRGFAANDPRYQATTAAVGTVLTGVATGLAAAAGAPLWGTIAVGAIAAGAVTLGIGAVTQWLFNSDKTVTSASSGTVADALTVGASVYSYGGFISPNFLASITAFFNSQYGGGCVVPSSGTGYGAVYCGPNQYYSVSTLVNGGNPNMNPDNILSTNYSGTPCAAGYVGTGTSCIATSMSGPVPVPKSMSSAVADVPVGDMTKPVTPELLANAVNTQWEAAAAQPGYAGLPFSPSDPVTVADVQAFQAAQPAAYPTVSDMLAPAVAPAGQPGAGTVAAPAPAAQPGVTTSPGINPAPSGSVQVNLGVDPVIGLPSLEATPTASSILSPILNLFPSLKTFVVPSHSSVCPSPSMSMFGKTLVLDGHCTLLEAVRPTLYAVMAFVWVVIGLFIILAA